jgi:hypothetical protein
MTLLGFFMRYLENVLQRRNAITAECDSIRFQLWEEELWRDMEEELVLSILQCNSNYAWNDVVRRAIAWENPLHYLLIDAKPYLVVAERSFARTCGHWRFVGLGGEDVSEFVRNASLAYLAAVAVANPEQPLHGVEEKKE